MRGSLGDVAIHPSRLASKKDRASVGVRYGDHGRVRRCTPPRATHTLSDFCASSKPRTQAPDSISCFHGMSRVRVRLGTAALCRSVCATVPDAGYWFLWHMLVDAFGPGESIMAWDSWSGGQRGWSVLVPVAVAVGLAERDTSASPGSGCAECGELR